MNTKLYSPYMRAYSLNVSYFATPTGRQCDAAAASLLHALCRWSTVGVLAASVPSPSAPSTHSASSNSDAAASPDAVAGVDGRGRLRGDNARRVLRTAPRSEVLKARMRRYFSPARKENWGQAL